MVKNPAPQERDSSEPEDDDYDSMIENGTDESESGSEVAESEAEVEDAEPENGPKIIKRKVKEDEAVAVPKKKQKTDKELYKPPTVEELNQLRETENLFHSNLFRLQIEEMLQQIRMKDKYKKLFSNWFEELKDCVTQIEETDEFEVTKTFDSRTFMFLNKLNLTFFVSVIG